MNYGITPEENLAKAFTLSQKALSIDDSHSVAHGVLGFVDVL